MIDPNLDHVGIVVPELEPAMEALSAHLGVSWLGQFEPKVTIHNGLRFELLERRTVEVSGAS